MTTQELSEHSVSNHAFAGSWHNQHNSEMVLMIGPDGTVGGSFRLPNLHPDHALPVVGFVCGDAIAFCVNFPAQGSVTSWVGHLAGDQQDMTLETVWHMAVHTAHTSAEVPWNSMLSGADLFQRGPRTGSMLWHKSNS